MHNLFNLAILFDKIVTLSSLLDLILGLIVVVVLLSLFSSIDKDALEIGHSWLRPLLCRGLISGVGTWEYVWHVIVEGRLIVSLNNARLVNWLRSV